MVPEAEYPLDLKKRAGDDHDDDDDDSEQPVQPSVYNEDGSLEVSTLWKLSYLYSAKAQEWIFLRIGIKIVSPFGPFHSFGSLNLG